MTFISSGKAVRNSHVYHGDKRSSPLNLKRSCLLVLPVLELLRISVLFGFCQSNSDRDLTSVIIALTSSSHGKEKGDLVW